MCLLAARSAAACKRVAVAPLAQQSPGADGRVAAAKETNGRSVAAIFAAPVQR